MRADLLGSRTARCLRVLQARTPFAGRNVSRNGQPWRQLGTGSPRRTEAAKIASALPRPPAWSRENLSRHRYAEGRPGSKLRRGAPPWPASSRRLPGPIEGDEAAGRAWRARWAGHSLRPAGRGLDELALPLAEGFEEDSSAGLMNCGRPEPPRALWRGPSSPCESAARTGPGLVRCGAGQAGPPSGSTWEVGYPQAARYGSGVLGAGRESLALGARPAPNNRRAGWACARPKGSRHGRSGAPAGDPPSLRARGALRMPGRAE